VVPGGVCGAGLEHRLRSPYEKSLMERANQYLKDRIEGFDYYYYPCMKRGCDLAHARHWLNLFVDMHYARRRHIKFGELLRFLGGERP